MTHFHSNMYWSSAGSSPRVVKATMDGSNERAIIYSPEVSHPVSLTIDSIYTISNTLFITDSDKNRILRYQQQTDSHLSDFLYTSTEDPIGLATTIDHLYYVDRASETLLRATKSGSGSNRGCEQVLTHLKDVRDIAIAKRQDWLNRGVCHTHTHTHTHTYRQTSTGPSGADPGGVKWVDFHPPLCFS